MDSVYLYLLFPLGYWKDHCVISCLIRCKSSFQVPSYTTEHSSPKLEAGTERLPSSPFLLSFQTLIDHQAWVPKYLFKVPASCRPSPMCPLWTDSPLSLALFSPRLPLVSRQMHTPHCQWSGSSRTQTGSCKPGAQASWLIGVKLPFFRQL